MNFEEPLSGTRRTLKGNNIEGPSDDISSRTLSCGTRRTFECVLMNTERAI